MRKIFTRSNFDDLQHRAAWPIDGATSRDYPGIAELLNKCFPDLPAWHVEKVRTKLVWAPFNQQTFVVLEPGHDRVIATASVRRREGWPEVAWVACAQAWHLQGISTALVHHCMRFIRDRLKETHCIAVLNPANRVSERFWTSCGFSEAPFDLA